MTITRHVCLEDAKAIADLYRPIVERTTITFELIAPQPDEIVSRIRKVTQKYPWLVACDRQVIGYAYASQHSKRAGYDPSVNVSVYVEDARRGQGIGSLLYEALLAELLGRKVFHKAFAGIALPNEASIALHRKFDFHMVGVYHEVGTKFGRWVDVARWERVLT